METLIILSAILVQQRYKLPDPPTPWEYSLYRRTIGPPAGDFEPSWRIPMLPDPDTPDNHIIDNIFGFGPGASISQNSTKNSSGHQLTQWSSSLLKRVAQPPKFLCTPENK